MRHPATLNLAADARSFLEASGYEVQKSQPGFLVVRKSGDFGQDVFVCVAIVDSDLLAGQEDRLLERFLAHDEYSGHKYLLTDHVRISRDLRQLLKELGVRVLTPALFFDTPFKYENDPRAAGALAKLARDGDDGEKRRVRQPFAVRGHVTHSSTPTGPKSTDLAEYLLQDIKLRSRHRTPTLWVVAAPAGQGKSRMFTALFARVFNEFQQHKSRRELFPRPLPIVAEHLRQSAGPNLRGLVDSVLKAEFARHAPPSLFEWMVSTGHALWMLDGLDEIITSDPTFVPAIEDFLTSPAATPLILISIRDSVLRSNGQLADLIDDCGDSVRIFELQRWGKEEFRQLAWATRDGRIPSRSQRTEDDEIDKVVQALSTSRATKDLASTPFYAHLMVDEWRRNRSLEVADELALLDTAVTEMCRREYGKPGPVDERRFPLAQFREWLENLASIVVENDGIEVDEFREFADLARAFTEYGKESAMFVEQMMTIPFLTRSGASGKLEFTHELLGEYLAGSYYAKQAQKDVGEDILRRRRPMRFGNDIGRVELHSDSILLRTMAASFSSNRGRLSQLIRESPACGSGRAFKNCVQLLALMDDSRGLIDESGLVLEGGDLTGLVFRDANLAGISLARADLSFADLSEATLRDANLDSVRLCGTVLPSDSAGTLEGATLAQPHFDSVRVGARQINSYPAFKKWAQSATRRPMTGDLPCVATRQLRHIFGKFVRPNGEPRTDRVDERGMRRGRKEKGVRNYLAAVEAVVKAGYLRRGHRGRVERVGGRQYSEVVEFVKNSGRLSDDLRALLGSVCEVPNCRHVQ